MEGRSHVWDKSGWTKISISFQVFKIQEQSSFRRDEPTVKLNWEDGKTK
jgi:hypothetical protein